MKPLLTRGEEILAVIDSAEQSLVALESIHYTSEDVRRIVQELGSRVERFFKSAVFPGVDPGMDFAGVINRLKAHGGHPKERRAKFHALRDLYNDGKHDPSIALKQRQALLVVHDLRVAMAELITTNPGQVGTPASEAVSRVLWLTGHDCYTMGATEVYVSLPLPDDLWATHQDHFWLDWQSWDLLKDELKATGSFYYGKEHFRDDVYQRFNEDDFIGAGIWDGDYRQLIQIIARHEKRELNEQALFPRDEMYIAVLSGLTLAAIDMAAQRQDFATATDLSAAIIVQADKVYAVPNKRPSVQRTAEALAEMIFKLPREHWRTLSGPYWNIAAPSDLVAHIKPAENTKIPLIIDDLNRIIVV
jgi:hypothetical protein